jgi:hypothetical protein
MGVQGQRKRSGAPSAISWRATFICPIIGAWAASLCFHCAVVLAGVAAALVAGADPGAAITSVNVKTFTKRVNVIG